MNPSPTQARAPAIVVATIGPNPAPLVELIWALARQRNLLVSDAYIVLDRRAEGFLASEVLARGEALDQLSDVLAAPPPRLHLHVVHGDGSQAVESQWQDALWKAALAGLSAAGEHPVVFGFVAGRRRTMTVMETVVAQLLARPQDMCVDVRVSERRVEGGTGFFFPEQPHQQVNVGSATVIASEVKVALVDVPIPRLGGLLPEAALKTWQSALSAGQQAIDAAAPPPLVVDLVAGVVTAADHTLPLSGLRLVWFAALAIARTGSAEGGWLESADDEALKRLAQSVCKTRWWKSIRSAVAVDFLLDYELDPDETPDRTLKKARSDTRRKIARWCSDEAPGWKRWLVPEKRSHHTQTEGKVSAQRLALPADRITIKLP